jgi:hypothetical protein
MNAKPIEHSIPNAVINNVEGLAEWLVSYCKRNKIPFMYKADWINSKSGEMRTYFLFKSVNQMTCFQRRGNQNYPYFEFL